MNRTLVVLNLICTAGVLFAQSAPTPEVGLDVNMRNEAVAARGWPLVIRAAVISTDGQALTIGLKSGPWTQALHLTISDASGAVQNWPVQLVPPATPTLSLSGIVNAEAIWLLAPSDTTSIADGLYSLSVTLDTTSTASNGTWTGKVQSTTASVQIEDEPSPLAAVDVNNKYLAFAAYGRLHGDTAGALTALGTLISLQPDNLEGYKEKADLLAESGDFVDALTLYQTALYKFQTANPNPAEPATLLEIGAANMSDNLAAQMRNISTSVHVTASGLVYSHTSKEFTGTVTVTNNGAAAIPGPISLVITGLPGTVTLDNSTGTLGLNGYPYIHALTSGSLNKGQSVSVPVRFRNPSMGAITFAAIAYSGM